MTGRISILVSTVSFLASSIAFGLVGDINLQITNLRSQKGNLLISVFNQADGFPGDPNKAFRLVRVSATQAKKIVIKDLEYGVYGLSLVHDENSNDELDTGTFGIPKEGIGFSRNPKVTFGPPSFSEAAFTFGAPEVSTFIKVKYF